MPDPSSSTGEKVADDIIAVQHLTKTFGKYTAVRELTLSVPRGEIFGFLGANGAGKTTTMRMLCGLTRPTAGSGAIVGRHIWRERYQARAHFGYVAQRFSLYTDLTVWENLQFFGTAYQVHGSLLRTRSEKLIEQMDLTAKRNALAGSLSGGQKQLLAIACALVHQPALLFLDEPTSGLDPVHRQQIWDLLYDLSHGGMTVFVTTHYMDEAERCTEVGFLDQGRLLAKATPLALKQRFKGQLLEIQVEPVMEGLVRLRAVPGVLGVALRSGRIRIYSARSAELLQEWQQSWPFPDLRLLGHQWVDADMEDVFKAYSQRYQDILDHP